MCSIAVIDTNFISVVRARMKFQSLIGLFLQGRDSAEMSSLMSLKLSQEIRSGDDENTLITSKPQQVFPISADNVRGLTDNRAFYHFVVIGIGGAPLKRVGDFDCFKKTEKPRNYPRCSEFGIIELREQLLREFVKDASAG